MTFDPVSTIEQILSRAALSLADRERLLSAVARATAPGGIEQEDAPAGLILMVPIFLLPSDLDRDARIIECALDFYSVKHAADVLGHDRATIRGTVDNFRRSFVRQVEKHLGEHYHQPPRNVRRRKKAPPPGSGADSQ